MKKDLKSNWLAYVALIVLLIFVGFLIYKRFFNGFESEQNANVGTEQTDSSKEEEKRKPTAKDFIVYDADGNKVKLYDFKGKPVVLNFWASWCGPCKGEMPAFQKIYEEYGDRVEFMIVNLTDGKNETVDTASEFIKNSGYTFPVYFDTEWSANVAYEVEAIPCTFLIDEEGHLVGSAVGGLSENSLRDGIETMLLAD